MTPPRASTCRATLYESRALRGNRETHRRTGKQARQLDGNTTTTTDVLVGLRSKLGRQPVGNQELPSAESRETSRKPRYEAPPRFLVSLCIRRKPGNRRYTAILPEDRREPRRP